MFVFKNYANILNFQIICMCISVCKCVWDFFCIHVCLRVHVYIFMCVCVRIYMRALFIHVCACQCLHVYVFTCVSCVCMRVCVLIFCVRILDFRTKFKPCNETQTVNSTYCSVNKHWVFAFHQYLHISDFFMICKIKCHTCKCCTHAHIITCIHS